MIIVEFAGSTGVRNTSRLYQFSGLSLIFFVPLVWMYVSRRKDSMKALAGLAGGIIMLGGGFGWYSNPCHSAAGVFLFHWRSGCPDGTGLLE